MERNTSRIPDWTIKIIMPFYGDIYGSKWIKMTKEQKMVKKQLEEKYKAFGLGKIRLDNLVRSKIRKMFGNVY